MTGIEIGPCLVTPVRRWIRAIMPHWDKRPVIRCPECAHVGTAGEWLKAQAMPCSQCGVMLQVTSFVVE